MLAPVGNERTYEMTNPIKNAISDSTADAIVTLLYVLNSFIALKDGNMIKLEINNEPRILIPITIVSAVKIDNKSV